MSEPSSNTEKGAPGLKYANAVEGAKMFFTGMVAAQVAAVFTNPIDVVKVRLQIQGELGAVATKNRGFLQMFVQIAKAEGVWALQKGIVPSLLRETSYSSIRLAAYEPIRNRILSEREKREGAPLFKKFLAGGTSGAIGAGLANPADLVKVRMQAATGTAYTSTWGAFREIVQLEGWRGLFRGTVPTIQRAAILTATQLGTYDHVKHFILNLGSLQEGILLHFSSGMVAGFAVAATTSPVDTIRTRLMNQPLNANGTGALYRSMLDCAKQTIKAEGVFAVYKGFLAQWARTGPHTTISLVVWEYLRHAVGVKAI
eukprot:m.192629 g.192629  ORF g.192629 m.192629 type:complete len:314 (+) comp32475_c4_seq1:402-1343(+)